VLDADERAELERLRRENTELRLDRELLKSRGLLRLRAEPVVAYRVIEAEKAIYTVKRSADTANSVPEYGFIVGCVVEVEFDNPGGRAVSAGTAGSDWVVMD